MLAVNQKIKGSARTMLENKLLTVKRELFRTDGAACFALIDKPNNYYPRKEVISSVPRNFLGIS
ncbi:hypothetical protein YC2023_100880 [Brassica napus]